MKGEGPHEKEGGLIEEGFIAKQTLDAVRE